MNIFKMNTTKAFHCHKALLFFILCCGFFGLKANEGPKSQTPLDCIIIYDTISRLDLNKNPDSLAISLATAIGQQAAPIITSGPVLLGFLERANIGRQKDRPFQSLAKFIEDRAHIPMDDIEAYFAQKPGTRYEALLNAFEQYKNSLGINEAMGPMSAALEHYIFANIPFAPSDWSIFTNKNHSLFLLVPHAYSSSMGIHTDIMLATLAQLGFNPDNVHAITLTELEKTAKDYYAPSWNDCKSMFIKGSGPWNIYLEGHGEPSSYYTPQIQPTESKAAIAGFSIHDFQQLLITLNDDLKTHMLYYSTCYGGGYHTICPYYGLHGNAGITPLNYTVAERAVTDAQCRGFYFGELLFSRERQSHMKYPLCTAPQCPEFLKLLRIPLDFNKFFAALHDTIQAKQDKYNTTDSAKTSYKNILSYVSCPFEEQEKDEKFHQLVINTPLIRFAGSLFFQAMPIDARVFPLSYEFTKASELQAEPIEVLNKKGLLIYPSIIRTPIIIKKTMPIILSMQPGPALHYIASIQADDITFVSCIENIFRIGTRLNKFIIIKKLQCKDGTLNDLVMRRYYDSHATLITEILLKRENRYQLIQNQYTRSIKESIYKMRVNDILQEYDKTYIAAAKASASLEKTLQEPVSPWQYVRHALGLYEEVAAV